jgi:hypothetical protein
VPSPNGSKPGALESPQLGAPEKTILGFSLKKKIRQQKNQNFFKNNKQKFFAKKIAKKIFSKKISFS